MEIEFKRDTSFRKQFFVPNSFTHPAKMDAQLLIWIIENYTQLGDVILDPMAGSGTMMLACTMGRNVVMVELEGKFCKMMADNWKEVQMKPQLGATMGTCHIVQGDARQIEGLLVDKCVFSPPYAEAQSGGGIAQEGYTKDYQKNKMGGGNFDPVGKRSYMPENVGSEPENISNLPYGQIDKIVTSPPYEGIEARDRSKDASYSEDREKKHAGGSINIMKGYQADSIITSPPYEGGNTTGRPDSYEGTHGPNSQVQLRDYRESKNNIGNLKSDSYLEAMLQVYQSCFAVLRDGGLMILVTKNFIRNKLVVRLDTDTIKLCEQSGFSFLERHYRKLTAQSFWRTIYHQKYPGVEKIENEDVLVFRK